MKPGGADPITGPAKQGQSFYPAMGDGLNARVMGQGGQLPWTTPQPDLKQPEPVKMPDNLPSEVTVDG